MKLSLPIHKVKDKIVGSISLPKLTNCLVFFILLFSSTQLGYHFWPSSSFVYGIRLDYLSPTLYFLDLVIVVYLLITKAKNLKTILFLFPLFLINLLFSTNPLASASWSLHLILYLIFIWSLPTSSTKAVSEALSFSLLFQVMLGALQTFFGHTIQGPFYWLGERMLNLSSPNVAKSSIFGEMTLRSYGTFSHPNILAGWLVVACLLVLYLSKSKNVKLFVSFVTAFGIFLSASRAAFLAFFGLVIPLYLLKTKRSRLIYFASLFIICLFLVWSGHLTRDLDLSINQRLDLQRVSLQIVSALPLFGAGANASISVYPSVSPTFRLLQPDHNSLTLLISWFGLVGVFALIPSFWKEKSKLSITLPLLPLLFFDHYFFTSPQGLFILLLYFRFVKDLK